MRKFTFLVASVMLTLSMIAQPMATKYELNEGPKMLNQAFGEVSNSKAITKIFHYDNNVLGGGLGTSGGAYTMQALIQIPAADLTDYVGESIDALRFGIDNDGIVAESYIVIYEGDLTGTAVVEDAISSVSSGWNTASLSSPYEIVAATDVYIGVKVVANAAGYTMAMDTDGAAAPDYSGHVFFNGDYLGTLVEAIGIDKDFNIQAIISDGEGTDITDLTITGINSTSETCVLSATETLEVILANRGETNINELFNLTVEIDDNPVSVQVSPTAFVPGAEMVVEVASFDLEDFGTYEATATFDFVDDFTDNNVFTQNLLSGDGTITVELLTDAYPGETAWTLTDSDGNVVATNGALAAETLSETDICVMSSGCYTWTITDSYGDGIGGYNGSPAGYFKIYYNGTLMHESVEGGNFGAEYVALGLGDGCAQDEITLTQLTTAQSAPVNTDIDVKGKVSNQGTANLTSFDVTYNIDGGDNVATFTVTGIDVAIGEVAEFTHDVPANFTAAGNYTINVTVSNPNGNADDESDNTASSDVMIYEGGIQRTVLVEEFSTEQCPNCPPVATYLGDIAHDNDNVLLMVHHAGFYDDPYTIEENEEMLVFFNAGGATYAPAGMMDRHYNGLDNDDYQGVDPGPVFWPGSPFGETRINDRLAQPAFVDVNFEGEFNEETSELTVTVSGTFMADFAGDLGVSLWIIEDGITTTNQAGATGEWTHHALVRDAISATFGDALTTSTNDEDTYSVEYTYTIDGSWVVDNLSLIATVNNMDETDVNNRTVHNAGSVKVADLIVGVNDNKLNTVQLYPNPFTNTVTLTNLTDVNQVIVSNILGQTVKTVNVETATVTIPTEDLNNGIYMITIIDKFDNVRTERVVKQ